MLDSLPFTWTNTGASSAPQMNTPVAGAADPASIEHPGMIAAGATLFYEAQGGMRLSACLQPCLSCHWLREAASGGLEAGLGLKAASGIQTTLELRLEGSFRGAISLDDSGWLRLRVAKSSSRQWSLGARLSARVARTVSRPEKCLELARVLAGLFPGEPMERLAALAGAIVQRIPAALNRICDAELSWRFREAASDTALLDCAFDFTPEGLALYREALNGDFTQVLSSSNPHARLNQGVLTHQMRREPVIEVLLPFMSRKHWSARVETLAACQVDNGPEGRILVYTARAASKLAQGNAYQSALALAGAFQAGGSFPEAAFKLSYTGAQTLERQDAAARLAPVLAAYGFGEEVNLWLSENAPASANTVAAELTLTIPGALVKAWLEAPGECDPDFFAVYSRVSLAVQAALRRAIPFDYFSGLEAYATPGPAYALLVYQASKPFAGRPRSEFTYDVMEERSMAAVYRSAAQRLPGLLESVSARLTAAGHAATAALYEPRQTANILAAVKRNPRLLQSLLVADTFFVGALVRLGLQAGALRKELDEHPQKAIGKLSRFISDFVQTYHRRLRRLYAGRDFPALGARILVEATAALAGDRVTGAGVSAVLRLEAGGRKQTFVNAVYSD